MADLTQREMLEHLAAAHKAGNTQLAQKIADRIKQTRQTALESQRAEAHKYALDQTPGWQKTLAGAGHGMLNVLSHLGLDPTGSFDEEGKAASKALTDTTAGAVGDFVGESAILAPIGAGAGAAVKGVAGASRVARALPRTAKALGSAPALAAAEGVTQGAIMSEPGDRTSDAAVGGTVAGTLTAGLGLGGRFVRGLVKPTDEARQLMSRGVDLSLGQIAGPKSALGKIEGASTELPWVGGVLEGARQKGRDDWVGLAIDTAAGTKADRGNDVGQHLRSAYESFKPRYEAVLDEGTMIPAGQVAKLDSPRLRGAVPDSYKEAVRREAEDVLTSLPHSPYTSAASEVKPLAFYKGDEPIAVTREAKYARAGLKGIKKGEQVPGWSVTGDRLQTSRAPLQTADNSRLPKSRFSRGKQRLQEGTMRPAPDSGWSVAFEDVPALGQDIQYPKDFTARDIHHTRSYIREQAGKPSALQATPSGYARKDLLGQVEEGYTDLLDKNLPVQKARALHDLDANYAAYNVVEKAVNKSRLENGFTPKQLAQAIQQKIGGREFAHGGGYELRNLAELGNAVGLVDPPRTGTRWTTIGGLLAATGAGGLVSPVVGASTMLPYAALVGSAKSPTVKRALTGQTAKQQELTALLDLLRSKHPLAVPTGVATGVTGAMSEE